MIDSTSQHPTWIYTTEDIYTVSLEISDGIVYDTEIKEDYITVAPTSLEIRPITGGLFKIKTSIRNDGEAPLSDITWWMTLDGGLIMLGQEASGTIESLDVDESVEISSNFIFGLGKTECTVFAESSGGISDQRTKSATILLFYIHIPPGGGI